MLALTFTSLLFTSLLRIFFKNMTGLRVNGIIRLQMTALIKAAFVLLGKYCNLKRVSVIQ